MLRFVHRGQECPPAICTKAVCRAARGRKTPDAWRSGRLLRERRSWVREESREDVLWASHRDERARSQNSHQWLQGRVQSGGLSRAGWRGGGRCRPEAGRLCRVLNVRLRDLGPSWFLAEEAFYSTWASIPKGWSGRLWKAFWMTDACKGGIPGIDCPEGFVCGAGVILTLIP